MKKLFSMFLLLLLTVAITAVAQDSTSTVGGASGFINSALVGKVIIWITTISGVLTLIAKLIPTNKPGNLYTWFTWISNFFSWLLSFIPDTKDTGGTHK